MQHRRDGSVVKNTDCCSSRDMGSILSTTWPLTTPVSEDWMLLSGLWALGTHMIHKCTYRENTLIHKMKIKTKNI